MRSKTGDKQRTILLTKRQIATVVTVLLVLAVLFWLVRNYSPYQICLRHSEAEALSSGMSQETAAAYAVGLCSSKIPFKN